MQITNFFDGISLKSMNFCFQGNEICFAYLILKLLLAYITTRRKEKDAEINFYLQTKEVSLHLVFFLHYVTHISTFFCVRAEHRVYLWTLVQ